MLISAASSVYSAAGGGIKDFTSIAHPSFPPSLFLFPIGSRIIESKAEATY